MIQAFTDKLAIGLSIACAAHCLLVPVLLIGLPSLTVFQIDNELVHFWLLVTTLPISLYALTRGSITHTSYHLLFLGCVGLALLVSALLLEESVGEFGENFLTGLGSILVVIAHFGNYRRCRSQTETCRR